MAKLTYTRELLQEAVDASDSVSGVLRYVGARGGGSHGYISYKIREYEIDISHFTGQRKSFRGGSTHRKTPDQILIKRLNGIRNRHVQLKRAMLEIGISYVCKECGIAEWNDKSLTLEIDHIDGDWLNDQRENLRFMCPNCHSQTSTFRNKKR